MEVTLARRTIRAKQKSQSYLMNVSDTGLSILLSPSQMLRNACPYTGNIKKIKTGRDLEMSKKSKETSSVHLVLGSLVFL